jgi:hypothetical protein
MSNKHTLEAKAIADSIKSAKPEPIAKVEAPKREFVVKPFTHSVGESLSLSVSQQLMAMGLLSTK